MSDSVWSHGLQYSRIPCPSLSPGVCSYSLLTHLKISQETNKGGLLFPHCLFVQLFSAVQVFIIINEAEVDVFWNSLAFYMIKWMLTISSLVPLLFLNRASTSDSSWFTYYWSLAWRILSITLLACERVQLCGSLNILWPCLPLGLEWKLTFSNPMATAEISKFAGILSATLSQHHLLGLEIAQLEFYLHYLCSNAF